MLLLSILAFIVIFSLLILVHEWGHFSTARLFGVRVEEFGLGLPPLARKLWRDKQGTQYTLNWLPLGGFVRMKGEDIADAKLIKAKDSFAFKPVWQRIIIVCAGVAMNFLTGFVLLIFVFGLGSTYLVPAGGSEKLLASRPHAQVVSEQVLGLLVKEVAPEEPAATAGLKKYDFIKAIDGQVVATPAELVQHLSAKPNLPVKLTVLRRNYEFELSVVTGSAGKIGIVIAESLTATQLRYPWGVAVGEAAHETVRLTLAIAHAVGGLFAELAQGVVPDEIGGPIAIAKETFYRSTDLNALLSFAAMLSITLAFFNILPIPALDGGRLLFLLYELVARRRVNANIEAKIHAAGFALLIGLILLISWQDIFG